MINIKEKLQNMLVSFLVKLTSRNPYLRNKIAVAILGDKTKVIMNITVSEDILIYNKIKLTPSGLLDGDVVTGCKIVQIPKSNSFVLNP